MECSFCKKTIIGFPFICTYCKNKFCTDHRLAEKHECIKTRYVKYVRKYWLRRGGIGDSKPRVALNITTGLFIVVCDRCGYTSEPLLIEEAGAKRDEHVMICGDNNSVWLEET